MHILQLQGTENKRNIQENGILSFQLKFLYLMCQGFAKLLIARSW